MKPICPYCNYKCHYKFDDLQIIASNLFVTTCSYNGIISGKCKIHACVKHSCPGPSDLNFFTISSKDDDLISAGVIVLVEDKTYDVTYFSEFSKSDVNISIIELIDNSELFKKIVNCKYEEPIDMENPISWAERAINRLVKLKAFY